MPLPFYKPAPAPSGVFKGETFPQDTANPLSRLFFHWITPLMKVGYSRPLQAEDLWTLPESMSSRTMADRLELEWMKRIPPSLRPEKYQTKALNENEKAADQSSDRLAVEVPKTPRLPAQDSFEDNTQTYGKRKAKHIASGKWAVESGKIYNMSFPKAVYATDMRSIIISSILVICAAALTVASPLVTRILIRQIVLAHDYHQDVEAGRQPPGQNPSKPIGYGIGVAAGLFAMLYSSAVFEAQGMQRSYMLGSLLRSGAIDLISRKSMRLSGKSRLTMTNGKINNLVAADASFLEWTFVHATRCPGFVLQIIIGIALLVWFLGYSALVGLGLLIGTSPLQGVLFTRLLRLRTEQQDIVDDRIRLLTEIINNMRAVKQYAYEDVFAARVMALREMELNKIRSYTFVRANVNATFFFMPVLAAILTFVTYSLTGHELDAATIFSSLQLYNIISDPVQQLPMVLSNFMDGLAAMRRIGDLFKSDELRERLVIDGTASMAVSISGDFQFDSAAPPDQAKRSDSTTTTDKDKPCREGTPDAEKESDADRQPFALRDLDLSIPHGALVCVIGRVGTGKTSLLLAMINELRQLHGEIVFGGPVSYVPQHAWVQSGTIRENITFGKPEKPDLSRVNEVIDACALRPDVEMWHDGDLTKVGERGITLSGGQRQRICIARAAYEDSAVVLLDDPLSAVDAHVGHHLVEHCLLTGPFANRTRFLVTHQLDVLPHADIILVMDRDDDNEGRIVQQGSYYDLMGQEGIFRTLIDDFGTVKSESSGSSSESGEDNEAKDKASDGKSAANHIPARTTAAAGGGGGHIIVDEERLTGSVSGAVYKRYLASVNSWRHIFVAAFFLIATQIANVGNSLFLGYWSAGSIPGFSQGQYMGIYAGFGAAYALCIWGSIFSMIVAGVRAGFGMFNEAFYKVMRSPTAWHDKTPTGRIISRLSKDIRMLDDKLAQYFQQLLSNVLALFGTFALVVYAYPWLGLAFIPLLFYFYISATYYRQTSREVKRVDSNLRSHVYSSFAEQVSVPLIDDNRRWMIIFKLAGLAVIRAFNQQLNFQKKVQDSVDDQNRAYVLTITTQRWLYLRIELVADLLVMLIAMFGVIFRESVNAARFGVVLTYTLAATYTMTSLVPVFAVCEQEMNDVERIQHYMDLETEAEAKKPTDPTEEQWPTKGEVNFANVQLKYRDDLPLVLKGLSFTIRSGEKVGIIGRTGAGKSSIAQALFRTVEISDGVISVDGVDLSGLGIDTLRNGIAIIPQDAFLFAGTVRDNMDPKGLRSDAELNDSLNLIQNSAGASHSLRDKFRLDAPVMAEGYNFSAGEKQLLALMRALAKGCRVLLLDEATSSVDPETDALIQKIIQTEFSHVTLISIAHRLQTVAFYDRILVMDAGEIAEFDTPLALFDDSNSIFRTMCEKKSITRQDLLRIQADAEAAMTAHKTQHGASTIATA
ncbi:P-loop containing nucleoside triphosphate hydrolase protein [Kockovaella imperatae]|uniref:p-loop containing nucleoside triphosphate hydrolase protein n=1 Tax=Kockovaella imperatae TaxID=4999 RepID=A0A1Y1UL09_9TREE|nr:P-loop containing nucleoside triphosphate hydrolase protein [Kockovaella imperatae]ORX37805.1 P-loop containing nucleoside triphosphate hydrolase protein [Kockovaella imperatae]